MNGDIQDKRERFTEEIRKEHRQAIFAKYRNRDSARANWSKQYEQKIQIIDSRCQNQIIELAKKEFQQSQFKSLVEAIKNQDLNQQLYGLYGVRKLIQGKKNPPLELFIDAGLVPVLMRFTEQTQYPQFQFEAICSLTNIAAGDQNQSKYIVENGGIGLFSNLLLSPIYEISEQAILALNNIAWDSTSYRNSIIQVGSLQNILLVMKNSLDHLQTNSKMINIIESSCWALSSIFRMKPNPDYHYAEKVLDALSFLIKRKIVKNKDIISKICWTLSNYCSNNDEENGKVDKIQKFLERDIASQIVGFLTEFQDSLVIPSLKIIGNITTGSNQQCQYLLNFNLIEIIESLLDPKKSKVVKKYCCWILSNLASGSRDQVERIFWRKTLMSKLLEILAQDTLEVKTQAVFIFSNMTENGNPQQLYPYFREVGLIRYYARLLKERDHTLLSNTLEALYQLFQFGEQFRENKENMFVFEFMTEQVVEELENLQSHSVQEISKKAYLLLAAFFKLQSPFQI